MNGIKLGWTNLYCQLHYDDIDDVVHVGDLIFMKMLALTSTENCCGNDSPYVHSAICSSKFDKFFQMQRYSQLMISA